MKKIFFLFLCVSCSHYGVKKDFTQIEEISKEEGSFYVLKDYKPKQISRSISSSEEITNRDIYFTTLYKQYQKISKIVDSENEIKSCPAYHQIFLDIKKNNFEKNFYHVNYKIVPNSEIALVGFPELGLVSSGDKKVIHSLSKSDFKNKKIINDALFNYNNRNYKELVELCDTGVSSNYFIFENMVSYYSHSREFYEKTNVLQTFMKMPLMTNFLIIDRFFPEYSLNPSIYNYKALEKLGATWFLSYANKVSKIRNDFEKKNLHKAANL